MESSSAFLDLFFSTLRVSTPILFAALGGLLSERSGVVNIALEGLMLTGAFAGAVFGYYAHSAWIGLFAAAFFATLMAMLYAFCVIKLRADQIVTGTALNILTMGLAPFISKVLFNSTGTTPGLALENRFSFEPMLLAAVTVVIIFYIYNFTKAGLWIQFAGEHPKALETSGVRPNLVRWVCVSLSGTLAGIGGASLSLFLASSYSPLMTGGRGFMALAALIFGKWKPIPATLACLFFAFTEAMQIRLQGVQFGNQTVPVQFIQILPYVVTIISLVGFFGRSRAPKELGNVYEEV